MILSTYSDVRMVWMRTHDYFDIFGCEDGLDEMKSPSKILFFWGTRQQSQVLPQKLKKIKK
jgi:hypothetical protein